MIHLLWNLLLPFCDDVQRWLDLIIMATEPRYYIFYKRNSFTSSTILFWYVVTTKTKTTNGKISTLKMIFFHFRLYIKIFEIFSFLLIPNSSYVKEIWILLLVSHFHGIALNPNLVEEATCFMIWFKLNYKAICLCKDPNVISHSSNGLVVYYLLLPWVR